MPDRGPRRFQTWHGSCGYGLKIGGTSQDSGATDVLAAATWTAITFDEDVLGDKIPLHIRFKAEGGILSWRKDSKGVNTEAADTRTGLIPIYDVFTGDATLDLQAAAESDLEYEIFYEK